MKNRFTFSQLFTASWWKSLSFTWLAMVAYSAANGGTTYWVLSSAVRAPLVAILLVLAFIINAKLIMNAAAIHLLSHGSNSQVNLKPTLAITVLAGAILALSLALSVSASLSTLFSAFLAIALALLFKNLRVWQLHHA